VLVEQHPWSPSGKGAVGVCRGSAVASQHNCGHGTSLGGHGGRHD
jgi:hypothetical protein